MRDGIRGCYHLKLRCGVLVLMATRSVGRDGVAGWCCRAGVDLCN